jgi:RIO-like serine/threonine protein kinase
MPSVISDNGVSKVWREEGYVYKRQPKHLCDNEWYALRVLYETGYVPFAEQIDISTIRMKDLGKSERVTNAEEFMRHLPLILECLERYEIRHGDLTKYALIVKNNRPYVIDWAESRYWHDPRPDKRREGDRHWLTKTMRELCP